MTNLVNIQELTANYVGEIKIGSIKIRCAVLNNEKRVFFQREVVGALTGNKKGGLKRYLLAKNLLPFVPEKFRGNNWDESIIKFTYNGRPAHGLEATDLIDICNMYISARNFGPDVLHESQEHLAIQADIIVNAFAKTGVIAVVDEATGFQSHREKDALRLLVEAYVIQEARKWMKEFPDEFFESLDRMYKNPRTSSQNRPLYYGKFINTYIYKPIQNGLIFDELNIVNPPNEFGVRERRLHQHLSEQIGLRELRNRIGKITALMQISPNLEVFKRHYEKMESKQKTLFDIDVY